MNNKKHNSDTDFQVHWQDASSDRNESVSIDSLKSHADHPPSRLRNATASLYTDNIYIEVSDMEWAETTTLEFTPYRIGFSSVISASSSIRYGHEVNTLTRSCGVGNTLFMLTGKNIYSEIAPGRLCTVTCSFDTEYAETFIGPLDQLVPSKVQDALELRNPLISSLMLRLMQEAVYSSPVSHLVAETFGQAILAEFAHWLKTDTEIVKQEAMITADHFDFIERYLSDLAGNPPKIADIASACGYSERYFAKLFRTQTGLSISHYVRSVRISKAKALLLETDIPLKEIAYRLGFSSAANFSSSFSTTTGITPGQFRSAD